MDISEVTKFLKQKKLSPTSIPNSDQLAYSGNLTVGGQIIPIKLVFKSKYPVDFPDLYIRGWKTSSDLQQQLGIVNINSDGKLCYIDPSGIWWDSSRTLEFLQAVLERSEGLLLKKLQDYSDEELFIQDFGAYWNGTRILSRIKLTHYDYYNVIVSDDIKWIKSSGEQNRSTFFSLRIEHLPIPKNYKNWPPTNLKELIDWLGKNRSTYKDWISKLADTVKARTKGKKNDKPLTLGSIFILDNPISNDLFAPPVFAATFTIDVRLRHALLGGRTKYISSMSAGIKLNRYVIERADPDFIYGRNMPDHKPPLADKKITVIGAGAIGGFLCSQLANLGAGSGKRGELLIIDHDILKPENIGRHYLGLEYVNKLKADALSVAVSKNHPDLNIAPICKPFELIIQELKGSSIIINATGMQTVGVALEEILKRTMPVTILHAWIEGQGAGARTLLNDRQGFACFRCIWNDDDSGNYHSAHPMLQPDTDISLTPAACHESYYAYPVMAAVKTATLAADVIIDYFTETPEPRLRNLVIRKDQCLDPLPDTNPQKSATCPVCL